jgi:hypothetical protein
MEQHLNLIPQSLVLGLVVTGFPPAKAKVEHLVRHNQMLVVAVLVVPTPSGAVVVAALAQ